MTSHRRREQEGTGRIRQRSTRLGEADTARQGSLGRGATRRGHAWTGDADKERPDTPRRGKAGYGQTRQTKPTTSDMDGYGSTRLDEADKDWMLRHGEARPDLEGSSKADKERHEWYVLVRSGQIWSGNTDGVRIGIARSGDARCGEIGQTRSDAKWMGKAATGVPGYGLADTARTGMKWRGRAWIGAVGSGSADMEGRGPARLDAVSARQIGTGVIRSGAMWCDWEWHRRQGFVWTGWVGPRGNEAWSGRHGVATHGQVWKREADIARSGYARSSNARTGSADQYRFGANGYDRFVAAWQTRQRRESPSKNTLGDVRLGVTDVADEDWTGPETTDKARRGRPDTARTGWARLGTVEQIVKGTSS